MKMTHLISCFLILGLPSAGAYELATHGRLTNEAYKRSVLSKDTELLKQLGIENKPEPFGEVYYDISSGQVQERRRMNFEQRQNRMPEEVNPLSIAGWLLRGAIREDDHPLSPFPPDDPVITVRVRNHFYDPVYNRALAFGVGNQKAPDWALGTVDFLANPPQPNPFRDGGNHFSILDAREAMYRALTGKTKDGADAGPNNTPATEAVRKTYWATTFRVLGDVVHLIQDMAQPQHTRNDIHPVFEIPLVGRPSVYEAYVEARATCGKLGNKSDTIALQIRSVA